MRLFPQVPRPRARCCRGKPLANVCPPLGGAPHGRRETVLGSCPLRDCRLIGKRTSLGEQRLTKTKPRVSDPPKAPASGYHSLVTNPRSPGVTCPPLSPVRPLHSLLTKQSRRAFGTPANQRIRGGTSQARGVRPYPARRASGAFEFFRFPLRGKVMFSLPSTHVFFRLTRRACAVPPSPGCS